MTGLIVFMSVTLLLLAAGMLFYASGQSRRENEALAERVGRLGTGEAVDELAGMHQLRQVRNPLTRYICRRFWGAGVDLSPRLANVLLVAALLIFLLLLLVNLVAAILIGVSAIAVTALLLQQRINARRRRINEQLPDFLEYVLRALTAGNTLEEALQNAALESVDPIRSLFLSVSRQVRLGASLDGTLVEAAEVQQLRSLHILALAARVNRRYGGSMRRVVKSMSHAIRSRDAAGRELKAMTGETRFSAWVVAAIPVGLGILFYTLNPGYYAEMLSGTGGRLAIGLAVALQVLGVILIWRMLASVQEGDL